MISLESRIKSRLTEIGLTIQRLASESGISEPTIHAIFNRGDAKLSQLEKIAYALRIPLNFLLLSDSQIALGADTDPSTLNNTQEKEAEYIPIPGMALDIASCQRALQATRELMAAQTQIISSLRDQLKTKDALIEAKNALLAAKDETITLLRASFDRPN